MAPRKPSTRAASLASAAAENRPPASGRRRTVIEEEELPPAAPADAVSLAASSEPHPDEIPFEARRTLDNLDQIPGEGTVRVSREVGGAFKYLRTIPRAILAEDMGFIGRTWGGGNFYLEIFDPGGGAGSNRPPRWVRRFLLPVDEDEYGAPRGAYAPQPAPVYQSRMEVTDLGGLDDQPQEGEVASQNPAQPAMSQPVQQRSGAEIAAKISADAQTALMAQMQIFANMFKPAANSADAVLEAAERLLAVRGGAGQAAPSTSDALTKRVLEKIGDRLVDSMDGGGTGGEAKGLMEIIVPKILDMFGPAVGAAVMTEMKHRAAQPPRPPVRTALPASPAARPHPEPVVPVDPSAASDSVSPPSVVQPAGNGNGHTPVSEEGGMRLIDAIKTSPMYVAAAAMILRAAKKGRDLVEVVDQIDAFVEGDETMEKALAALLEREPGDLVAYLATFEPEIVEHASYLKALQAEFLRPDPNAEPDATPESAPAAGEVPVV